MRFVRVIVVLALIASIAMNIIMYTKWRGGRSIMTINKQPFTERDLTTFLKAQGGFSVKAVVAERMLVEQEAKKQNLLPTDKEVDDEYNAQKEANWQFARKMENEPWMVTEVKMRLRQQMAKNRLIAKDVALTDEDIKSEYNSRPNLYDTPNKAKATLAVIMDPTIAPQVKQMLEKEPPVSPTVIIQEFSSRKVAFLGEDNVFTFIQPFGTNLNKEIFGMKPNEVKQLPPTPDLARMGARSLIIRVKEFLPGKKADLNDPRTKEKIKSVLAQQRGKPWQEILSGLWANADFWSEDPSDKKIVEMQLFPDRAREKGR